MNIHAVNIANSNAVMPLVQPSKLFHFCQSLLKRLKNFDLPHIGLTVKMVIA